MSIGRVGIITVALRITDTNNNGCLRYYSIEDDMHYIE